VVVEDVSSLNALVLAVEESTTAEVEVLRPIGGSMIV
jgi:hypothetical protein